MEENRLQDILDSFADALQDVLEQEGFELDVEIIAIEPEDNEDGFECDEQCEYCDYCEYEDGNFEEDEYDFEEESDIEYEEGYLDGKRIIGMIDALIDEEVEWDTAIEIVKRMLE